VKLGAILGPVKTPNDASDLRVQAANLEKAGYESLWAVQAIGRGFTVTDPLITLCIAATVTKCEVGTAILQLPLYNPMDLAHRVYSIMQLTENGFVLGLGTGSTQSDFTAFSQNYDDRFVDFENKLIELKEIFQNNGNSEIHLNHWSALEGGPPLLLGTWGKNVKAAASKFDGWIASAHYRTPDQILEGLSQYRSANGKRAIVSTIQISKDTDTGELKDKLRRFSDAGFDDAVVMFLPGAPSIDQIRSLI
tara:strand:- start:1111 stop:1860 length:750 start_codon:yes stop_codon:yes gene_type:complete